ncbi:MAG: nitrilase-related carbon-nitrogen hydrolase [Phycisphaerae bacterium]
MTWLGIGSVGLAFGQGHWPSGVMLLIGLVCMTRFFASTKLLIAFPLFVIAHVLVWEWAYRGMAPLPTPARLGMEAGVSVGMALCFSLHRWVSSRSDSFWTTLALPCGLASFEFASARLSPGGTWGSLAYTFVDDLAIVQVASLFGWTSLTFLIGWLAASINWVSRNHVSNGRVILAAGTVGLVLASSAIYGSLRVTTNERPSDETMIACIVAPSTYSPERVNDVWAYTRGVKTNNTSWSKAVERIGESLNEHLLATEREAERGADFVFWPEVSASITMAEYETWTEAVAALAISKRIHVGVGLMVFRPAEQLPSINKYLLVGPDGEVLMDFVKATRPPGAGHIVGDGILPTVDTPPGIMTAAICFDLDFPHLIGQAGRMRADVLFAPSNDWRDAAPTHAAMARMRAIEQGVTLIRPTRDGITIICNPFGQVVSSMSLDDGETGSLLAGVNVQSVSTLYGSMGDLFNWLCVVSVACLIAVGVAATPQASKSCSSH